MVEGGTGVGLLLTGLAGCLGWGLRGVFGHQTGAMIPGALIGAALAATCLSHSESILPSSQLLFLVAVGAAALSSGGVMTYGQTLGLVHGERHPPTYWWGLLGCFVKGGVWFGLGTVWLSVGLSGDLFNPVVVLIMANIGAMSGYLGRLVCNRPFNPPWRYPFIYFSRRAAEHEDYMHSRPRRESWGGMLLGLLAVTGYIAYGLHQPQIWWLAGAGFVAGGLGFSVGEVVQAWGLWRRPLGPYLEPWVDWWKVMEMTFGLIAGLGLALVLVHHAVTVWTIAGREYWPLAALTGGVWLFLVVGNLWGQRLAAALNDIPLLQAGLLLTSLSAAPVVVAPLFVAGFLLYVSGADVLKRLRDQLSPGEFTGLHLALIFTAIIIGLGASVVALTPRMLFLMIGLTQSLLALAKALIESGPGPLRHRFGRLRAALPTVVLFLVLTAFLVVVAPL